MQALSKPAGGILIKGFEISMNLFFLQILTFLIVIVLLSFLHYRKLLCNKGNLSRSAHFVMSYSKMV